MDIDSRMHIFRSLETTKLLRFSPPHTRRAINDRLGRLMKENKKQATPSSKVFGHLIQSFGVKHDIEVVVPVFGKLYYLDFLIGEPFWVAIEIDGGVHKKQSGYDSIRDDHIMKATGWIILRFTNEEVQESATTMWEPLLATLKEVADVERYMGADVPDELDDKLQQAMYKHAPGLYKRYFEKRSWVHN